MPGKVMPWTEHVIERVRSGPVSFGRLLTETAALVPPGRGYRMAINGVEWQRSRSGAQARPYADPDIIKAKRVRNGQMAIARKAITDLIAAKRIEEYEDGAERMLREGPLGLNGTIRLPRSRMVPWTLAALRAVREEDVDREELVLQLMPLIPVEKAIENRKRDLLFERRRRSVTHPVEPSVEVMASSGARSIVSGMIHGMVSTQRLAFKDVDGKKMVTRGPKYVDPDEPV